MINTIENTLSSTRGNGAFNPLSLFSNGEEGVIYDPSDISRYMSNLGPELVVNGTFDTDTAWTKGAGWSIGAGVATASASPSNVNVIPISNIATVAGKSYIAVFDVVSVSSGGFTLIAFDGYSNIGNGPVKTSAGTGFSFVFTATNTTTKIYVTTNGITTGSVDNISVKELTNFAACTMFQDSAGTTPVTSVEQPVGLILDKSRGAIRGPELFPNGDFSSGATGWSIPTGWLLTGSTCTATAALDSLKQIANPCIAGKFYEVTFDWTHTGGLLYVRVGVGTAVTFNTSGRKRAILMANGIAGIEFYGGAVSGVVDNISVKEVYGNHAYQTTAIDRPILKQDVNGKYYLSANGTNTSMRTNNINFSATDEVSVFAGIRKLSDSAVGMITELSVNSSINNGSFNITGPSSALNNFVFGSIGTSSSSTSSGAITAPVSRVISGIGKISNDTCIIRTNGVAVSSSSDQGTGNYGNYPLYLFRRAGTSLPFNGNLYGLIIRGKLSTDSQIQKVEKYLAKKSGITL